MHTIEHNILTESSKFLSDENIGEKSFSHSKIKIYATIQKKWRLNDKAD